MGAVVRTLPIRLEGVAFEHGATRLLGPLDLTFEGSQRTAVMGPNGAGKSLLLRLCHGLIAPTAGRVRCGVAGAPTDPRVRRRQAMVFQRPVMLRRSVKANVLYALNRRGIKGRDARSRADEALSMVGLQGLESRPARVLSGGEQQRLALARAWVLQPEVMFLDEPTSALDPQAAQAVESTIQRFHERGTRIVLTTHSPGQARRLADEIVFMADGGVVERAEAEAFLTRPQSRQGQQFLAGEHTVSPAVHPRREDRHHE